MQDYADHLKSLGSQSTEYQLSKPHVEILESFPNQYPDREYHIVHEFKEFTSLCPKTGQPDFATIVVTYIAHMKCVETKSLKLYYFAYRNEGSFMETICNRILDDLIQLLAPRQMQVMATYNPRGGIQTSVTATYRGKE